MNHSLSSIDKSICIFSPLFFFFSFIGCKSNSDSKEYYFQLPQRVFELGSVECGEHTLEVSINNMSSKPRRLLAVEAMCKTDCCYEPKNFDNEVVIEPHASFILQLNLLVKRPVPFSETVRIYLEDVGTRIETITINGTGIVNEIQ